MKEIGRKTLVTKDGHYIRPNLEYVISPIPTAFSCAKTRQIPPNDGSVKEATFC